MKEHNLILTLLETKTLEHKVIHSFNLGSSL